jgi:hypothetical protein
MRLKLHSYRFAQEILEHHKHRGAWDEVRRICEGAPLFTWPGKSKKDKKADAVQQLMNVYFDRRFAIDEKWDHHPLATRIESSGLRADFRKRFGKLGVQVEVQFGNMARWYSDIFKFQTAYSQNLIQAAISILPTATLARRMGQNVANYERAVRELPSAELSITIPILLIGMEPDYATATIDVSLSQFPEVKELTGRSKAANLWRVVNGSINGLPIAEIGPDSPVGPQIELLPEEMEDEDD